MSSGPQGHTGPSPIWKLFKTAGFPLSSLVVPSLLALLAAAFEGASVALLLPAVRGALHGDLLLVRAGPLAGPVASLDDARLFRLILALLVATSLARVAFAYLASLEFSRRARRLTSKLRQLALTECLAYGKGFFDDSQSGRLLHVLTGSIGTLTERLVSLQDMLGYLLMLLAYLTVMLCISWKLTACVIVLLAGMEAVLRRLMARIKVTSHDISEAQKGVSGKLSEILTNVGLVKASSSEALEIANVLKLDAQLEALEVRAAVQSSLVRPIQEIVFLVATVAVLYAFTPRGSIGPDTATGLLVFAYLVRRASGCLIPLGRSGTILATMHGAATDVLLLVDRAGKPVPREGSGEFRGLVREIRVRDVSFSFPGGGAVLDGLDFRVKKGETVAIVGPSGAGKTTLINLLLRFYEPDSGAILFDDKDIREFTFHSLRSRIALVSQDTPHFNDSIRKNVTYPLKNGDAPEEAIVSALKKARLYDYVRSLPRGLDTPVGDRGVKLSGGEKQRLSIARAILRNAEILVLDEATSSLDSQTEALIQESIDELLKGRTAIVIAHRLSTVRNADSIVVIDDGKVLESGSRQDLLEQRGRFFQYWQGQRFE